MARCATIFVMIAAVVIAFTGCGGRHEPERAPYLPLAEVELIYGRLVTAGNHPTPHQNGTGERLGLFQDANGTIWGLPLVAAGSAALMACAPPALHEAKVTDTFPAGSTILGSTNEPTGWRGGTGDLEILLRDAAGTVRWQAVHGAPLTDGPVCWAPESPGPPQPLPYYQLAPKAADSH